MPSGWSKLPAEILNVIFINLDKDDETKKEDMRQCALTCRNWRQRAQESLLTKIAITATSDIDYMLNANLLFGTAVKEISCLRLYINRDDQLHYLNVLNTLFPRLKKFKSNFTLTSSFYNSVINGMFLNLNQLPLPIGDKEEELYVACLKLRKNKITSICLEGSASHQRTAFTLGCMIDQTDLFPKLQHLRVEFHIVLEKLKINDLIEAITPETGFPCLKELEIFVTSPAGWTNPTEYLESIQPIEGLEKLSITYNDPILSDEFVCVEHYMVYIMNKFPDVNHMEMSCRLEQQDVMILGGFPFPSTDTVVNYLSFLSEMSCCNVPKFFTTVSTGNVVRRTSFAVHEPTATNLPPQTRFDVSVEHCTNNVPLGHREYCFIEARFI